MRPFRVDSIEIRIQCFATYENLNVKCVVVKQPFFLSANDDGFLCSLASQHSLISDVAIRFFLPIQKSKTQIKMLSLRNRAIIYWMWLLLTPSISSHTTLLRNMNTCEHGKVNGMRPQARLNPSSSLYHYQKCWYVASIFIHKQNTTGSEYESFRSFVAFNARHFLCQVRICVCAQSGCRWHGTYTKAIVRV